MSLLRPLAVELDRRLLVLLRAPVQDLGALLPGAVTPWVRRGMGLLIIDYGHRPPTQFGPLSVGQGASQLALRIPVRSGPDADSDAKLWVPQRWREGGIAWRLLRPANTAPAEFYYSGERTSLELEVRATQGAAVYLRAHCVPRLRGSLFATLREAELELTRFGLAGELHSRRGQLFQSFDDLALERSGQGLEPLAVDALQSKTLPNLLPGIEEIVEFDSAFLVVRRRRLPGLPSLQQLARRPRGLSLPPEGALSLSVMQPD
jgi:hypothetical protein